MRLKMVTHSLYHKFYEESTFGDTLQIFVTTREIKPCSFVMVFKITNKHNGDLLGEGWQRVAFQDLTTGKFCRIPSFIREMARATLEK